MRIATRTTAINSILAFGLLMFSAFTPESVQAQEQPVFVWAPATTRIGPNIYFNGGYYTGAMNQNEISSQLVSLPLNVSWTTKSPPWKILKPGNAYGNHGAVATTDNQTLLTFTSNSGGGITLGKYNLQTSLWIYTISAPFNPINDGFHPVVDPTSGEVYIPGRDNMNIYSPKLDSWREQVIPINPVSQKYFLSQRVFGNAVFNNARKTIMYFGGYNTAQFESEAYITEYSFATSTWSILNTTGVAPTPIADFCMAASEDGYTVALFGGRYFNSTRGADFDIFSGDFYLLDVATRIWRKVDTISARAYAGCQIIGDQFIAWGGADGKNLAIAPEPPRVYDLTKKQWVDTYTPPPYYKSASSTNGGSNNSSSGNNASEDAKTKSADLGAILGGVLGSLLVVALAVAFFFYQKSRATAKGAKKDSIIHEEKGDGKGDDTGGSHGPTGNEHRPVPGRPHGIFPSPSEFYPEERLPGPHECLPSDRTVPQKQSFDETQDKPLPGPQACFAAPSKSSYTGSIGNSERVPEYYYDGSQRIPMAIAYSPDGSEPLYPPGMPYAYSNASSSAVSQEYTVPSPVTSYHHDFKR